MRSQKSMFAYKDTSMKNKEPVLEKDTTLLTTEAPLPEEQSSLPVLRPLSFFKDTKGCWRTQSLFVEYERPPYESLWTLGEEDLLDSTGEVLYLSLRKIYLSYDHAPGYEHRFVKEQMGSYPFWLRLSSSSFIAKDIEEWRAELLVKIKSEAVRQLIKQGRTPSGTAAAKYVSEEGWTENKAPKRGRPSKAEKEAHLKENKRATSEVDSDFNRIRSIQ